MQLEKQVVSLELAKKLKSLGVKQESAFYWAELFITKEMVVVPPTSFSITSLEPRISALTVAELGEMLPKELRRGAIWWLEIVRSEAWRFRYGNIIFTAGTGKTEADARAEMLIFLIEKGLVKTEGRKG